MPVAVLALSSVIKDPLEAARLTDSEGRGGMKKERISV